MNGAPASTPRPPADGAGAAGPPLDPVRIAALRDYGRVPGVLLADLLGDFLAESPALLADLAADDGGPDGRATVARAVHRFKGASGFIGATRLEAACRAHEDHVRRDDGDGARAARAAIRHEVAEAAGEARRLLPGAAPP